MTTLPAVPERHLTEPHELYVPLKLTIGCYTWERVGRLLYMCVDVTARPPNDVLNDTNGTLWLVYSTPNAIDPVGKWWTVRTPANVWDPCPGGVPLQYEVLHDGQKIAWSTCLHIPGDTVRWESADGSRIFYPTSEVLKHRPPIESDDAIEVVKSDNVMVASDGEGSDSSDTILAAAVRGLG